MLPLSRLWLVHMQIPSEVTPTVPQQDSFLRADSEDPAILSRHRCKGIKLYPSCEFSGLIPISQKLMIAADPVSPWSAKSDTQIRPRVGQYLCHLVKWESVDKAPLSLLLPLLHHRAPPW